MPLSDLKAEIQNIADPVRAKNSAWFFKTGKGQYGYKDVFCGITVPRQRILAKKYRTLPLNEISHLLKSKIHEERLIGLFILILQYERAEALTKQKLVDFYLQHTDCVNNWDLVDASAPKILGQFLIANPRKRSMLYVFVKSKNLWIRRIAILSTFAFIRNGEFDDCLKICALLLNDSHDLIHKATGWMLREVGKKSLQVEEQFLNMHYKKMPRTMLRYAIERFSPARRAFYMKRG